jgi:hypothetical protein
MARKNPFDLGWGAAEMVTGWERLHLPGIFAFVAFSDGKPDFHFS